jgi:hypothetical protein
MAMHSEPFAVDANTRISIETQLNHDAAFRGEYVPLALGLSIGYQIDWQTAQDRANESREVVKSFVASVPAFIGGRARTVSAAVIGASALSTIATVALEQPQDDDDRLKSLVAGYDLAPRDVPSPEHLDTTLSAQVVDSIDLRGIADANSRQDQAIRTWRASFADRNLPLGEQMRRLIGWTLAQTQSPALGWVERGATQTMDVEIEIGENAAGETQYETVHQIYCEGLFLGRVQWRRNNGVWEGEAIYQSGYRQIAPTGILCACYDSFTPGAPLPEIDDLEPLEELGDIKRAGKKKKTTKEKAKEEEEQIGFMYQTGREKDGTPKWRVIPIDDTTRNAPGFMWLSADKISGKKVSENAEIRCYRKTTNTGGRSGEKFGVLQCSATQGIVGDPAFGMDDDASPNIVRVSPGGTLSTFPLNQRGYVTINSGVEVLAGTDAAAAFSTDGAPEALPLGTCDE